MAHEDKVRPPMTERISPRYVDIDLWPTSDIIASIYEGQLAALSAVNATLDRIVEAVDKAATRLEGGGRLIYIGAGTSGRLAVQDGVELCPTFGWSNEQLVFCIAGGLDSLVSSSENAEDNEKEGRRQVKGASLGEHDVAIGLAASGATAFTVGALEEARRAGALTIGISNNPDGRILRVAHHPLLAETGSEIVAGSTRMKAGTAQKVILTTLSTAIMVRLGRVYKGLMVNMSVSNRKLERRAIATIREITGRSQKEAKNALDLASGDVKLAILLCLGEDLQTSRRLLDNVAGNLRLALLRLAIDVKEIKR